MYATIRVLRNIVHAAAAKGASLARMCSALGIKPGDLNDADRRIEGLQPVIDLWTEVLAATNDPAFGLHMGRANNPSILGVLGYLMQSCRDMKETYVEIVRYQQMVSGWVSYEFKEGRHFELIFKVSPMWEQTSPETGRQAIEMAMSGALNYIYLFTGKKIYPLRAELSIPTPVPKSVYEQVFQCAVQLGAEHSRLLFGRDLGDMPLISADGSLYASFAKILAEKHADSARSPRFAEQVKTIITRDFAGKTPSLEIVAAHMNVSERSFQRRLQQDGESYRSLAAKIKKELAINLLRNTDATIHAISEVLGYTEPSAFHRAFKSWTHTSPAQKKLRPD